MDVKFAEMFLCYCFYTCFLLHEERKSLLKSVGKGSRFMRAKLFGINLLSFLKMNGYI